MLDFCLRGTLESNLRDSSKSKEMFINKTKISLASDIAKGMEYLANSKVKEFLIAFLPPEGMIKSE